MQIHSKPSRSNRQGYALMIVLVFLGVSLIVLASLMSWTASSAKLTSRNNQYLASESAAEAADENVIATITRDYLNQAINPASAYTPLIPTNTSAWPVTYNFSDASGTLNQTTVIEGTPGTVLQPLASQFSNLQGLIQTVTVTSKATPVGQLYTVPATVTEQIQFDTVPIFQFAIFYNLDMEIDPGQSMTVIGPVYCNASIWAGNANLTFSNSVDAVGVVSTATTDPFSKDYTGSPTPTFDVPPLTNQPSLTMPISGTNQSAASPQNILGLPPAGLGAPNANYLQASNQAYLFNESDLIISNSSAGINGNSLASSSSTTSNAAVTVYYQNSNVVGYLTYVMPDATNLIKITSTKYVTNLYYSFVTNVTFYDWRESDTVQALQIDVGKFTAWLNTNTTSGGNAWNIKNTTGGTDKGHNIDSIYVINKVPISSGQLPAVRVTDGAILPSANGLTVATSQPLYVLDDYNIKTNSSGSSDAGLQSTAHTWPAALMGDALTILSDGWKDSVTTEDPTPTATTVNAACLEGIVKTVPTATTAATGYYSGGTENFLRLLESWDSPKPALTYNGSIIVMFYSQYATNYWSNTHYYDVPKRNWSFDENFTQLSKLPPLTPSVKVMLRTPGGWSSN